MKRLLEQAAAAHASDLHLTVGTPPFLRVDGELILMSGPPLEAEQVERTVRGLMNEEQVKHFEREWELCFSLHVPDLGYFRVTAYRQRGRVEAAIRLGIPEMKPLAELGIPVHLGDLTRRPHGLILVTGPTGQGKTTTLNALVDLINREQRCKIVMVEDPIEYRHSNVKSIIVQQEVGTDTKAFGRALIHALRQDPDVIAVGEMRDLETIAAALTAAETGHLVLATLHANDCAQTVNRVVDVFPPHQQAQVRYQLSMTLRAVISQRLLPRVDKQGRVLACSLMLGTPAVRNLIRENRLEQIQHVMTTGRGDGMVQLDDVLQELYRRAIISHETAVQNMDDPRHAIPRRS